MRAPPDGYEWINGGPGIVLIDPQDCPAGHRFRDGQRGPLTYCGQHDPHLTWRCACGQHVYRVPGRFVGELECLSGRA